MRHAPVLALSAATMFVAAPASHGGQAFGARRAHGLGGFPTHITPESRPAALGAEAVFTPAEVAQREGAAIHEAKELNKPTIPVPPLSAPVVQAAPAVSPVQTASR